MRIRRERKIRLKTMFSKETREAPHIKGIFVEHAVMLLDRVAAIRGLKNAGVLALLAVMALFLTAAFIRNHSIIFTR